MTRVDLHPKIGSVATPNPQAELSSLHDKAHGECFIAS
jgi:organic hydroperoxide reductase OsmC/OhrA